MPFFSCYFRDLFKAATTTTEHGVITTPWKYSLHGHSSMSRIWCEMTDWLPDWKTGHCSVPKPFTFFFSWDFLCCFSMLLFAPLTFPSSGLSSSLVRSLSSGLCDWPLGRVLVSSEMLSRQYVLRMSSSCRLSSSAMSQWDCAASATKQSGGW